MIDSPCARSWALRTGFLLTLAAPSGCTPVHDVGPAPTPAPLAPVPPAPAPLWGLVLHGGAGNIDPEMLVPDRQAAYRAALEEALRAGHRVLEQGGESMEAVVAAITVLEDSPLFNAGKGAVFNHNGKNELDAAIMDGRTLAAGAVAGVHHVKNPIVLARRVMEKSAHVMLIGDGAEEFARTQGIELVDPGYFYALRLGLHGAGLPRRRHLPRARTRAGGALRVPGRAARRGRPHRVPLHARERRHARPVLVPHAVRARPGFAAHLVPE